MSDNEIQNIEQLILNQNEQIIYLTEISLLGQKRIRSKLKFILTEFHIYILIKKTFFNNFKIINSFNILELKKSELLEDNLILTFGENLISIKSPDINTISLNIISQAHRIMSNFEFSNIITIPIYHSLKKSNLNSFLYRFNYNLKEFNLNINNYK